MPANPESGIVRRNWPVFTSVIAIVVMGCFVFDLTGSLVYGRQLENDLWRFVTASFQHWDIRHLGSNLLGFIILGTLVERRSQNILLLLVLAAAVGGVLVLHRWLPEYTGFAGISIINYALLAYLVVADESNRWLGLLVWFSALSYQIAIALSSTLPAAGTPTPVWQLHVLALFVGSLVGFLAILAKQTARSRNRDDPNRDQHHDRVTV